MEKIISFHLRNNFIYIVLYFIFSLIRNLVTNFLTIFYDYNDRTFITFLMCFSELVGGLFCYLFEKFSTKRSNNNQNKVGYSFMNLISSDKNKKMFKDMEKVVDYKYNRFIVVLLLILATIFDLISFISPSFFDTVSVEDMSGTLDTKLFNAIFVIFSSILCFLLLKIRIYKHHGVSLIISIVCFVIILVLDLLSGELKYKTTKDFILYFVLTLIVYISYALVTITNKYIMEKFLLNPYFVLFCEGVIGTVFALLLNFFIIPVFHITKIEKINFHYKAEGYKVFFLALLLILYFLISAGKNANLIQVINYFGPLAETVSTSLICPFTLIYNFFIESSIDGNEISLPIWYYFINIVCCIIIIFASLVYNEFIVVHLCDLDENTFYCISRRSRIESQQIDIELPFISIYEDDLQEYKILGNTTTESEYTVNDNNYNNNNFS